MAQPPMSESIRWRMHFASAPEAVHRMIATDEGRRHFWAEESIESKGVVDFTFPNGMKVRSTILENEAPRRFSLTYFGGSHVSFDLTDDRRGGTDLTLTETHVPQEWRAENLAGWISVLMALKAAMDFSVDLRNHDPTRTWDQGYADN